MTRVDRRWRAVVVVLTLLAAPVARGDRAKDLRVVPHPAPLPTAAVDAKRFPESAPARIERAKRTIAVAAGGSIRRALEEASTAPDARVLVQAGTYAEDHLRIGAEGTVLAAAPGARVVVRPASRDGKEGLAIAASRATVSGIAFEGFSDNGLTIVNGLRDVVVSDVEVSMPAGGNAIWIGAIDGLLIERSRLLGGDLGITIGEGPGRDVAIRDVYVKNRTGTGQGWGADAIAVERGDNVLVNGVEVAGSEADGIDLKVTRAAVLNVHVHHVRRNGIKLWRGGDIVNALVHDCGEDASIVLEGDPSGAPTRYRIVHAAIAFHNRSTGGAKAHTVACGYDQPGAPIELEVANTYFWRNTGGWALSKGTKPRVAGCVQQGDVKLADPEGGSLLGFAPGAASPLVDGGARVAPAVAVDLLGRKRVLGRGPDVGPIEAR